MDIPAIVTRLRLASDLSQRDLARRAGTSQPAIARLERGDTSPTVATLERLARAAGFRLRVDLVPEDAPDPVIAAYKKDVDRTLLRANLDRTVEERVRLLMENAAFVRELRGAAARAGRKR